MRKPLRGESLAERDRPGDKLHAEAHDEEHDRRVKRAELFELDGYAVRPDRGHRLPSLSDGEPAVGGALGAIVKSLPPVETTVMGAIS